jgi:hypothetical protein
MPLTPHEQLADTLRCKPVKREFNSPAVMTCRCGRDILHVPDHLRDCAHWVCWVCAGREPDIPLIYGPKCIEPGCLERDPEKFRKHETGGYHRRCQFHEGIWNDYQRKRHKRGENS